MGRLNLSASYEVSPYKIEGFEKVIKPTGRRETDDKKNDKWLVDGDGEIHERYRRLNLKLGWTDTKQYVKVFTHHIPELTRDLSECGNKLLWYIIHNIKIGEDFIVVHEGKFLEYGKYKPSSRNVYYRAVSELIKYNVIARKAGTQRAYWININFIFNGDRTRLLTRSYKV